MIRSRLLQACGLPLISAVRMQSQAAAMALRPSNLRAAVFQPNFDMNKMTELLDHDNHDMRKKFREFVSEPVMIPRYNIPLLEERDVALERLQVITYNIMLIIALMIKKLDNIHAGSAHLTSNTIRDILCKILFIFLLLANM